MSSKHVDVAVVGGGPAGACCALRLAQFGLSVALFHRESTARQHVGESLPSSIRVVLETLRMELPREVFERRPPRHLVYWGAIEGGWDRNIPESSLLVWRGPFDRFLRDSASRAGVRVLSSFTRAQPIECRFTVDASGRSGFLARSYRRRETAFRTLALTGHFRTHEESPPTVIEAFENGFFWSAPLANGLRDVTVMLDAPETKGDRRTLFEEALALSRHTRKLVASSAGVGPVRGIDATPYSASRCGSEDFLLVGDAASFIDPLSAHGVHKAMDGALTAAAVIRTILERPSRARAAISFYEEREKNIYQLATERLSRLYRQETRFADRPFWRLRSASEAPRPETVPPRPPLRGDMILRPAPGVTIVEAPVLENDYIEIREALISPWQERPVRYLGPLCLAELYKEVAGGGEVGPIARRSVLGFDRAFAGIDWLFRSGYLEPTEPQRSRHA